MSISQTEPYSISQYSQASHKSFANQGLVDKISFKSINDFFLYPFYDEFLQMIKLNPFFPFFIVISFLIQAIKTFSGFTKNVLSNFFTNFYFTETYGTILIPIFYFLFDIFYFVYVILQYRTKRMFNYWQLYLSAIILNFFNVIFYMPVCGVFGYSIVKLDQIFSSHYSTPLQSQAENYSQTFFNKNILYGNFTGHNLKNKSIITSFFKKDYYHFKRFNNNTNFYIKINASNNEKYFRNDAFVISKKYDNVNIIANKKKETNENKSTYFTSNTNNYSFLDNKPRLKDVQHKINHHFGYLEDFEFQGPSYIPSNLTDENNDEMMERNLFKTEVTKYTFSLLFTFIEAIIHSIQIIYNFHFISDSPYLDRTIFGMWDCKVFILYILMMGINQSASYVLTLFPLWCTISYYIFAIVFDIYILYYTFFQPFIKISMNSFFQSLLTYNLISNIIIILYNLKDLAIYKYLITFMIILLIPFFAIYYLINKKIINNVNQQLSPQIVLEDFDDDQVDLNSSGEIPLKSSSNIFKDKNERQHFIQMTDDEKREMFDKYVFQSIEHALLYLRVGVTCSSPYFTDFSFIRYMKDTYGQIPIQMYILRLSAFFPSEHQFLNYGISILAKREDFMSTFDQFVMYQLHRINVIRQSNVSKELQSELAALDNMCDETISTIRGFWAEIFQAKMDFEMTSLQFIRKMTLNTKSCYIDALDKFPNSTHILNSYCRFLCEACGDYIECFRIGQKIRLIEQGKHANADFCFHAFVNVFPQYLKKKILNEKGNFINDCSNSVSSHLSAAVSTGQISTSFDNISGLQNINTSVSDDSSKNYNYSVINRKRNKVDLENLIEQENFEILIGTLFTNGKSRLTIQQIADRNKNYSLISSFVLSAVQTIIFFLLIFLVFSFMGIYQTPIQLLKSTARTSEIVFYFQHCSLTAGVQYLSETYNTNISSKVIEYLNIREENLPNFPCTFILPMVSLSTMTKNIVDLIDQEMKYILKTPLQHQNEIKIYTGLKTNNSIYSLNRTETSKIQIRNDYNDDDSNSNWMNGVNIYKLTNNNNNSFYKVPLRNALEYFKAVVDRLAYEHAFETIIANNSQARSDSPYSEYQNQLNFSKFKNVYFELLVNGLTISEPFSHLFKIVSESGINIIKSNENSLIIMSLIVIVLCIIIFLPARIYCYCKIRESVNILSMAIKKVKNEDIIESMKPIYLKFQKVIKFHSTNNHSIYESSPILVLYALVSFLSIFILLGFFCISAFRFKSVFGFFEYAQQWENDSASRFLSLTTMMNHLILNHFKIDNFNFSSNFIKNSLELLHLSQKLDLSIISKGKNLKSYYFIVKDNATVSGYHQIEQKIPEYTRPINKKIKISPIPKKFSKKLILAGDEPTYVTNVKCTEINNSNFSTQMNLATYLDCISLESKVNLGIQFYRYLEKASLKSDTPLVDLTEFITSLFILDKYLYRDLPGFQNEIAKASESEIELKTKETIIYGTIGLLVSLILFLIESIMLRLINFTFEAFKQLIMVLPPSAFTNNIYLINFLIGSISHSRSSIFTKFLKGNNNGSNNKLITDEEILLNSVADTFISTDENLIIQSVNPAIQKMTGFLPDQLLGQSLTFLIPLRSKYEDNQVSIEKYPFYQRLGEIRGSNSDRVAELNTKILTDKGQEILVRATIIGMFDKNRKFTSKRNNRKNKTFSIDHLINNNHSYIDDVDEETFESTVSSTSELNSGNNLIVKGKINNEFTGVTVILKDISKEKKLKKSLKQTKKKNEILLNLLLPQPVLEEVRASRKPVYYYSKNATIVKFVLNGFDEYTGSMMPKTIISNLQTLFQKIDQLSSQNSIIQKNQLFNKEENQLISDGNNNVFTGNFQQSHTSLLRFNFNFDLNSVDDQQDEDIQILSTQRSNMVHPKTSRNQNTDNDEEENVENDENCDFSCIYNIRNDNDQFFSISGLFTDQNELKKQAESCLRYALKVNKIIKNAGLEDQVNMFLHAKIAVCMGGPVYGFVDDPDVPEFQILTDLMKEADEIKNGGGLDVVYINENVYNNIDTNKFEIEEIILPRIKFANDPGIEHDINDCQDNGLKVYAVHKCLKTNRKDSIFAISTDSEN